MSIEELREQCRRLSLKISGNKIVLQECLKTRLRGNAILEKSNDEKSEDDDSNKEEPETCKAR